MLLSQFPFAHIRSLLITACLATLLVGCSSSDDPSVVTTPPPAGGGSGSGNSGNNSTGNSGAAQPLPQGTLFYFKGFVQKETLCPVPQPLPCFTDLGSCYVEMSSPQDLSQIQLRIIAPHPHESTSQQTVEMGLGPFVATYDSQRRFYRFRDSAPQAPVKDLILFLDNQGVATQLKAEFWHDNHHDPMSCDALSELTTTPDISAAEALFTTFETIPQP